MTFQTYNNGYIKSDILLSIGILVSNNIEYVEKALKGIKPILDAVPSELIIVETVGEEKSDGSIDVCRKYTDKIYHFEWCNDFSAARNELLKHACGEWFVFQDDDEWFEDVKEFIGFFTSDEYKKYNTAIYGIDNLLKDGKHELSLAQRMIHRRPETRFVGKVHESFEKAEIPVKYFSSAITHVGYLFTNEEEKQRKLERNLLIIEKELQENGLSPEMCAQKIQTMMLNPHQLDEWYQLSLEYADALVKRVNETNNLVQWIICAQARYWHTLSDGEGVIRQTAEIRKKYKLSKFASFVLAEIEIDAISRFAQSRNYFPLMEEDMEIFISSLDYFLERNDEKVIELQLDFPKFDTDEVKNATLLIGAQLFNKTSDFERAFECWKRVKWEKVTDKEEYKTLVSTTLTQVKNEKEAEHFYKQVMGGELFSENKVKNSYITTPKQKKLQTYKDGYVKSDIKLTIGMLVSNHIQYIEKCMEGLKPLLDAVPAELVILDTVGPEKTDGSIEVCKKYTDKIYRFEWCNDFSAARNALLERSNGEWFIYQDDDEWFDDVNEFIEFFNSDKIHKYNAAIYFTRDYTMDGSWSMGMAGRIIRRKPDTHFEGRVHEQFNEAHFPAYEFECFTHHMGYVFASQEEREQKNNRNITLLEEELKENGLTPLLCAQMVQELMNLESRRDEGFELCTNYVNELVKKGYGMHNCTQWSICALARYFLVKQDGEGIINIVKEIRNKYRLSHYAALALAEIEVDGVTHYSEVSKHLDLIKEDVEAYFEMDDFLSAHPDERILETQLDFPRFYTDERKNAMRIAGAQVCNHLQQFEQAFEYWKGINWTIVEEPSRCKASIRYTLQNIADPMPLADYYKYFMRETIFEKGFEKYLPSDLYNRLHSSDKPEKSGNIVLSIGMLVSNNVNYIRKCMEGLKPILEAIPSELIIIDTVGPEQTDGSIEICKEYTDKIYRFEWCDDFAAARNEVLKYATGEWFMFQDDDEWFENPEEIIQFFKSGEYKNFNYALYNIKNYISTEAYSVATVSRLIKRQSDTRFVGRIHEHFEAVNEPGKLFSLVAEHKGYEYKSPEEKRKKRERNLKILDKELTEKGIGPERCAQKIQEIITDSETRDEAYNLCLEYIDKLCEMGFEANNCVQWMITSRIRYFMSKGDGYGAVHEAKLIREKYKLTKYAQLVTAALSYNSIATFCNYKDYLEEMDYDIETYMKYYDYFLGHQEEMMHEVQLDFIQYSTGKTANMIIVAGAQRCNEKKEYAKAYDFWKRADWSIIEKPYRYMEGILFTLRRIPDPSPLMDYYKTFMNPDVFEPGNEKYLPKDLYVLKEFCARK